ncbi:MAG: methyltransferase domain-containing protein [Magnetovibrio sp.]|nr:methyltransferase domain-containing protein [Magnetovibrio sp.]
MAETMTVFNRAAVRRQRDRAARTLAEHDFLFAEAAERLADRLLDTTRRFPLALDLGCHGGELGRVLAGRGGIETLVQADLSPAMAQAAANTDCPALACDEETLPFAAGALDAVLSNLSLHWVNDLPGALIQIRQALKPDGLFLASCLGGETLAELRHSLYQAETEVEGGLSPRFSPLIDVRDLGNLLGRAGFALPVVDAETVTVSYEHPMKLMRDLRGMGEANANSERRRGFSRRATLMRAAEIYAETFSGPDGRVPATFEILTMTAWAPDPSQQKPLQPGSARTRLAEALGTDEIPGGEKAGGG